MNSKLKAGVEIVLIVGVFIFISYLAQANTEFFEELIRNNLVGMVFYFFFVVLAIVIAPLGAFPFHPIAANVWGVLPAFLLIWSGVCFGAFIAFVLSRRYGVKLIRKFISIERIHEIEKKIPKENVVLSVVISRLILPVEVGSYFFGLFSRIKLFPYMVATIVGTAPMAFLSSYVGTLPVLFQIDAVLIFFIVVLFWGIRRLRGELSNSKEKVTSFF